ncbi:MAG: cytochrome C [candidate division Zixibacteria bacterium]|nr:cytochrome C [candidate division Zixibacteria bacterium]
MINMDYAHHRKTTALLITSLVLICLYILSGCSKSQANIKNERSDVVFIKTMSTFGSLERTPVPFPHDLHTTALAKQNKDCNTCHLNREDGKLSQRFLRLTDDSKDDIMLIYHENCINCHNKTAATGIKSGPNTCGECHQREPNFISTREPIGFDNSLHHRHTKASDEKCELCHHQYNEQKQELFYAKGEESSCRYCHKSQATDNVPSLSMAAHQSCLDCHIKTKNAGPVVCAGCHDKQNQLAIKQIKKPARLKRNQPDFILVSASEHELESSKLNTVPFSHVGHESFNNTCRVCHHESMQSCTDCHTLQGTPESAGITLQQAFHNTNSDHSCVGCHETKKAAIECAGCHSLMEHGRQSEHACKICHTGPQPENLVRVKNRYTSLSQFKPKAKDVKLTFKDKDIPEDVTIAILSEKYEPAVFPHRRIINRLMSDINGSKIAEYFHGHEDVVCQGCHHHSPIGVKPPLCESCHGKPFNEADLFKPGLMGAYHQQCLGCHKAMKIEEPSGCNGCHANKKLAQR